MPRLVYSLFAALLLVGVAACEDEQVDPDAPVSITFRADRGCTYGNDTVTAGDTLLVRVVASQGTNSMRWMRVFKSYDGGPDQRTDSVSINEDPFTLNKHIVLRFAPGSERWTFSVLKSNGDAVQRSLTFTVQ
ncbi:MAG: hypothetical protein JNM31_13120 [Flavobacteriales bacterium]|nr:hypothetical protein [Flavobacteriales bacterium]